MMPNQDQIRRQENSLQIWILEAKGVPVKRKYYCELCLDHTLYSRTTSKVKTDLCFWGEQFEINHLPKLETVCINLYREADRKKKKDRNTLVGYVQIPVHALSARHPVEKWYCVVGAEKMSGVAKGETPALRVKAKYQSVTILPLRAYDGFVQYLQRDYLQLCLALEPSVSVKAKEDFATSMVRVLHKQRLAKEFLCDLIMSEVQALDNEHLMFRGNSLATKAMEAYMKLVGDQYLHDTLAEFIQSVMESDEDCEVDPQKLSTNLSLLPKHQETLTNKVHLAWGKIVNSFYDFPIELRQVFFELRQRLHRCDRSELADYLISSSIFLRFLCPAILSPSLFNLVQEYPSGKTARSLTLIAKTIQTLANFTRFGGKEHYMEFMNKFIEGECDHMRQYLMRISSPLSKDYLSRGLEWEGCIDLGKELSLLHSYLTECWVNIDIKRYREAGLHDLQKTLEQLTEAVQNPTSPLNSAFPSGSLSPISPISDYENNNQTADDSSPISEHATTTMAASTTAIIGNHNYAQTIPTSGGNGGGRSYAMYKTSSPLIGPNSTKRSLATNNSNGNGEINRSAIVDQNQSIIRTPASNLQTDDDYVWYSALDDNLRVRHMGMVVQQSRALKQQQQQNLKSSTPKNQHQINTGQLVAGNGTESISYVDDHQSDYFSRPVTEEEDDDDHSDEFGIDYRSTQQHGRKNGQGVESGTRRRVGSHGSLTGGVDGICVVHGVNVVAGSPPNNNNGNGVNNVNGATSSGYQSLNYSTSNSSSPVDSSGSSSQSSTATKNHRQQQQQQNSKEESGQSKRAAPLAIANPLYSMQTVPLIQQKAPSYSLPDIHHQTPIMSNNSVDVVTQQPLRQQSQFYREHQHGHYNTTGGCRLHENNHGGGGGGYHVSSDSSFEEQQQQRQGVGGWSYQHHGQQQRPQSQQTPPQSRVPLSMLSHSLTPQVLQSLVTHARSDTMTSPSTATGSAERSPALHHKSPLPRTNPRYGMSNSPMSPRLNGSGILTNGGMRAPPVRRTRTEGGIGVGVATVDIETADDTELSQKFIEELESMKRRLEETQSRLLTEGPPTSHSPTSTADENELTSIAVVSTTAPPTLKRRTASSSQEENNNNNINPRQQNGDSPGKWTEQVKPIISRLKVVEHELQEELNSSMKKQQIIEAQQKRIELLMTANERLMTTLSQLKDRYTGPDENPQSIDNRSIDQPQSIDNRRHHNHSKVSPVLSISSSVSASSSSSSTNDDDHHNQRYKSEISTSTSRLTSAPSELSSMDSYCFVHGNSNSPNGMSPSSSIPRCSSPQPPPQPTLPAPVLPQHRAVVQQQNSEQYVSSMKTTEC